MTFSGRPLLAVSVSLVHCGVVRSVFFVLSESLVVDLSVCVAVGFFFVCLFVCLFV